MEAIKLREKFLKDQKASKKRKSQRKKGSKDLKRYSLLNQEVLGVPVITMSEEEKSSAVSDLNS